MRWGERFNVHCCKWRDGFREVRDMARGLDDMLLYRPEGDGGVTNAGHKEADAKRQGRCLSVCRKETGKAGNDLRIPCTEQRYI